MSASDRGEPRAGSKQHPTVLSDSQGLCIAITCGNISGHLFLSKLEESKKAQGKCVLVGGKWYTPSHVEALAGKKARKWKQSLLHLGRPLSEFNLLPLDFQGWQHTPVPPVAHIAGPSGSGARSQSQPHIVSTPASTSSTARMVNVSTDCTSVVDPVLAFIKAFQLRGDTDSLRRVLKDRFSGAHVESAKRLLWDSCSQALDELNLTFHVRRDSENRSQLSANIDDIIATFKALDSKDLIPPMFCEASDLFRLPPLSLDPVAEQVNLNSQSLNEFTASVKDLESILSLLVSSVSSVKASVDIESPMVTTDSYAARTSSFIPSASRGTKPTAKSFRSSASVIDDRNLNLILFGLPESRSILDLKKVVDEIFEFLAERPVQIKDVFRLRKHNPSSSGTRPRPVLIKLSSTWDRKVLLLQKRNLQHFRRKHLFLRADVPPEYLLRQGNPRAKVNPQSGVQQLSSTSVPVISADNSQSSTSVPVISTDHSQSSTSVTVISADHSQSSVLNLVETSQPSLSSSLQPSSAVNSNVSLHSHSVSGVHTSRSSPESVSLSSTSTLVEGYTSS